MEPVWIWERTLFFVGLVLVFLSITPLLADLPAAGDHAGMTNRSLQPRADILGWDAKEVKVVSDYLIVCK